MQIIPTLPCYYILIPLLLVFTIK
ncbi:rCG53144 [Rattus norvegicus]|uniref:RCG53144 n=1 Tax=Rattus norvegicus TaxID=10116 RepID=A6JMI4_RAT|nr:rCG53144 [Rattus norvegicus]